MPSIPLFIQATEAAVVGKADVLLMLFANMPYLDSLARKDLAPTFARVIGGNPMIWLSSD